MMTTASAPAFCALRALTPNSQNPRWTSAMSFPPEKFTPAKSAASQPLVLAAGLASCRSTGTTGPVTVPSADPTVNQPAAWFTSCGVRWWIVGTGTR